MRDSFNFNMLPIVQDNMNYVPGARSLTNVSSNGYYGYQPPLLDKQKEEEPQVPHAFFMEVEVQFENHPNHTGGNRKRAWDFGTDFREFKKRRQNECSPFVCQQLSSPPNRDAKLRKPTHNIPDMPRCFMEKISVNAKKKTDPNEDLLEELLKETHGCTIYHWNSDGQRNEKLG